MKEGRPSDAHVAPLSALRNRPLTVPTYTWPGVFLSIANTRTLEKSPTEFHCCPPSTLLNAPPTPAAKSVWRSVGCTARPARPEGIVVETVTQVFPPSVLFKSLSKLVT